MKYYSQPKDSVDQDILRSVEALCTQDEPPACAAACPVHVDARLIIRHIKNGEWDKAYKLYAKVIPFPRIISKTCPAPCRDVCKRADLGGALLMRELEEYIVSRAIQPQSSALIPKKNKSVAIIGGSLRGLTAAGDLARKGYAVTIYEKSGNLGGGLRDLFGNTFTVADMEADFESVSRLPVIFRYNETAPAGSLDEIERFRIDGGYDGVYVACDGAVANESAAASESAIAGESVIAGESATASEAATAGEATIASERTVGEAAITSVAALPFDPATLETGASCITAGRRGGDWKEGYSSIRQVYDGKSAAITLDRLLQGVSVTVGREKEGPYGTRLYTSIVGIADAPPISVSADGTFDEAAATAEAMRCIDCQCLECVKKCTFLSRHKYHPGRYIREVYNNLSIPLGTHHANKMINSCAMCSRCEAVCPNGLDMKSVFLNARRLMVATGKMPQSAHEFALLDMERSMGDEFFLARPPEGGAEKGGAASVDATSGDIAGNGTASNGTTNDCTANDGIAKISKCEYVFFPGCQLPASEPELTMRVYADLVSRTGGMGLMLACCGIMAHWAGETAKFEIVIEKLKLNWEKMGKPVVITACPFCGKTLRESAGFTVIDIWDFLADRGMPNRLQVEECSDKTEYSASLRACPAIPFGNKHSSGDCGSVAAMTGEGLTCNQKKNTEAQSLYLHHACGARYDAEFSNKITTIASAMGYTLEELVDNRENSCCGYGGLLPFAKEKFAGEMTDQAIEAYPKDQPVLTYCINCRDRFLKRNRDAVHLLELIYEGKLNRRQPTWSERQENRIMLKRRVLSEFWGEEIDIKPCIEYHIAEEVYEKMETLKILRSEITSAIENAEKTGEKFIAASDKRFITGYRPGNVTFWVEYIKQDGSFSVTNVYTHRMFVEVMHKRRESANG